MHLSIKYLPVLLLGTAITGCSMAGTGDFFADDYAKLQQAQMPHYFGAPKAAPVQTGPTDCYAPSACQTHNFGQSAHAVQPDAHAYGQSVRGHNGYVQSAYGTPQHGLRGRAPSHSGTYGTLGVTNYEAGEDLYGAQARFGYQLNKYFGAEVEGSLGLSKDSKDIPAFGAGGKQVISVENSFAGFGVLRYPLVGALSGYGRLGYHRTELDEKVSNAAGVLVDREYSVNGVAYGSGLEYAVSPRTAVRLDYTVYDFDGPDSDAVSLAVSRKF